MPIELKYLSPREQVKKVMRTWIADGELISGKMIPSENLISRRLDLSRGTVRTALEELEIEGILEKRRHRRYVSGKAERKTEGVGNLVLLMGTSAEDSSKYRDTGFGLAVQAGILDWMAEHSKNVISAHFDNIKMADLKLMLNLRPEGAILTQKLMYSEFGAPVLEMLKAQHIPCILEYADERHADADKVLFDHEQGNYDLTRYAISLGCKDILCFYPDHTREYWFKARHRGYRKAIAEYGLEPMRPPEERPMVSEDLYDLEHFNKSVRMCIGFLYDYFQGERQPDCILANSDWEASITAAACRKMGVVPNKDVLLMGFDNKAASNPWVNFEATNPIATVDKHNTTLGRVLAETLFERINGKLPPEPVLRMVKTDLVILNKGE
ncbi:MAG: substrate-binding domain-containing protein [Victivallales bacterium]|nr:substrate-binding domain-containing protein [Victivallales bacterium]